MKPFDLEKAKAGAKVVTRDGTPATIVSFNNGADIDFKIIALHHHTDGDVTATYPLRGFYYGSEEPHDEDLMMAEPIAEDIKNPAAHASCSDTSPNVPETECKELTVDGRTMRLTPFDATKWTSDRLVVDVEGHTVHIITTTGKGDQPVIGQVEQSDNYFLAEYSTNGQFYENDKSERDLFFAEIVEPETERYVNIFEDAEGEYVGHTVYSKLKRAKANMPANYLGTFKLTRV